MHEAGISWEIVPYLDWNHSSHMEILVWGRQPSLMSCKWMSSENKWDHCHWWMSWRISYSVHTDSCWRVKPLSNGVFVNSLPMHCILWSLLVLSIGYHYLSSIRLPNRPSFVDEPHFCLWQSNRWLMRRYWGERRNYEFATCGNKNYTNCYCMVWHRCWV